jgi:crossover junction endodeoxyribonuclease RusA
MSAAEVSFRVLGNPVAQGSKRHVGGGVMVEAAKGLRPWREAVAWEARAASNGAPLEGPLHLDVAFRFPMPKARNKAAREAGRIPKVSAPDLDKLVRAVCDALTVAALIVDDRQIVSISAVKFEVTGWTGAEIALWPFPACVAVRAVDQENGK